MKRMKIGIVALVIAVLAITTAAVAAQGYGQGQGPGRGQRMGRGADFQVIADTLGIDLATLQSDLQSGKTIADIAAEKNVELTTIVDAVVAKQSDNLKAAVTDGRLTQEQADAQTALLKANLNALFTRTFDQLPGNRPGFGQRGNMMLDVLATTLGVDAATLQTELKSGKTIADIAKEKNVELSTVVEAVAAEHEAMLTTAVTAGRLTQEQADAHLALMKANLTTHFTRTFDANGRGGMGMGGFGGHDNRGFGGPMGDDGQHHNGPMGPGGHHGPKGPGNAPVAPEATATANA